MEFNPKNPVVQRCIQAMAKENEQKNDEAKKLLEQAWHESTNDFEKFLTSFFLARHQQNNSERLTWYKKSLAYALKINDANVKSAFYTLYASIAKCHEGLHQPEDAKKFNNLAEENKDIIFDSGPFYHGTKADLKSGDMLTAGRESNYKAELLMNHIYFTAMANGAGLAAALAKGEGRERVYVVEPTGPFENDPNVTDKKFPGNLTRSYRTTSPLKVVGELDNWENQTPEDLQKWRERLANSTGEIIN